MCKDGGHPAKSQVCSTLQSQKASLNAAQMKALISARCVSKMAPALRLLLTIHTQSQPTTVVGGWVGVGWGWEGSLQKVMPGCKESLAD